MKSNPLDLSNQSVSVGPQTNWGMHDSHHTNIRLARQGSFAGNANERQIMKKLSQLVAIANQPKSWLVKDLILAGDQIMIAAAPKAGKTLLASQLALAVASGGSFLGWQVDHPAKILYLNLEVNETMFADRVHKQMAALSVIPPDDNLMVESDIRSINILDPKQQAEIAKLVRDSNAELVFFDVLARSHCASENSNSEMKEVMKELRLVCGKAASVVIHHSRKPPQGQEEANLGAYALRGASAVHGEVDLVLSLAKRSGQGARYSIKFSARNIREPEEMFLDLDESSLLFSVGKADESDRLINVLNDAFSMSPALPVVNIKQKVMAAYGVEERQAQRLLQQAVESGLISQPQRRGKDYWYSVLNDNAITCFREAA